MVTGILGRGPHPTYSYQKGGEFNGDLSHGIESLKKAPTIHKQKQKFFIQVIQSDLFSPYLEGHQQPLKGSRITIPWVLTFWPLKNLWNYGKKNQSLRASRAELEYDLKGPRVFHWVFLFHPYPIGSMYAIFTYI